MVFRVLSTKDKEGTFGTPCKNARLARVVAHKFWTEYIWEVEVNTIDEIMNLVHETNHPVIILDKGIEDEEDGPKIEIYDTYRE